MQTVIDEARQNSSEVLVLDGGDIMIGTLWDRIYKGQLGSLFQNMLGVQAMVRSGAWGVVPVAATLAHSPTPEAPVPSRQY